MKHIITEYTYGKFYFQYPYSQWAITRNKEITDNRFKETTILHNVINQNGYNRPVLVGSE